MAMMRSRSRWQMFTPTYGCDLSSDDRARDRSEALVEIREETEDDA